MNSNYFGCSLGQYCRHSTRLPSSDTMQGDATEQTWRIFTVPCANIYYSLLFKKSILYKQYFLRFCYAFLYPLIYDYLSREKIVGEFYFLQHKVPPTFQLYLFVVHYTVC